MEIHLSTQQVCDAVHASMRASVTMEQVLSVWHNIGLMVREQLEQRKGVRLEKFGSFSFDIMGEPCFNLTTEFKRTYRVRQVAIPTHDNTPISKLNFTQLSRMSGVDRNMTERLYEKCISVFGTGVRTGQNALLTIHRVAEIFVNNDSVKCAFMSEFVDSISQKMSVPKMRQIARPGSAPRSSKRESNQFVIDSPVRPSTPSRLQTKSKSKSKSKEKVIQGKKHIPQPRSENPITGDFSDSHLKTGKKFGGQYHPNNRNPIFGEDSPQDDEDEQSFDQPFSIASLSPSYSQAPRSVSQTTSGARIGFRPPTPTRNRPGTPTRADANSSRRPATPTRADVNLSRRPGTPTRADANPRRPPTPTRVEDPRALAARALGADQIVDKIRKKIVERGGVNGIKGFVRLINIMDNNGDKRLTREELMYGMRDYGINISKTELEQLFLLFDRDRNGFIDVNEFLIGIRGDLNDRRKRMVKMAFDILDVDGSGFVTIDELNAVYDVSWNPAVRSGKITKAEAMKEFMSQWDRLDGDGVVSFEEFLDYYKGVSSSIDDDDYFELMIRNAWRIAGGTGMAANTANKRVLVTNRDGSQSVATVEQELGMKAGDKDAVRARLARQGIEASSVELHSGLDTTERPRQPRAFGGQAAPRQAWADPPRAELRSVENNSAEILHRCLYDPPVSFEQLASKFRLSLVGGNPTVTKAVFLQRLAQLDPQLSKGVLSSLWGEVAQNSASSSLQLSDIHSYFANRYGKDKSTKSGGVVERAIAKIIERSGGGLKGLQRSLAIMDDNGDKRLSKAELKKGLADYGVELNNREIDDLFLMFDRDRNGFIDVDEFFIGIRGDLNDRRKRMVKMAFDILDVDGSGFVTIDELNAVYDVSWNPAVRSGKITKAEAMKEFMSQWDRLDGDGVVSFEEFLDYYKGVSSSIDGDDYFELMIRNAWRIAGGTGMAANTANKRVLVTNRDGSQSVATVEQELGMKAGDKDAVRARLARQGIEASSVELHGGLDTTERPRKERLNASGRRRIDRRPY